MSAPVDPLARLDELAGADLRLILEALGRIISRTHPEAGYAIVAIDRYPPTAPSGRVQVSSNMEPPHLADALAVLCRRIDAGAVNMETPASGSRH